MFPTDLVCTEHIYRRVDCYHARETKRNLWSIYMYTKKWRARCSERRDRRLSLFGGLCSQTVPPSNYVYIVLSARIEAPPALGSRLLLCIWLARMAKGKGYTCRVDVSRKFGACAYVKCAPDGRIEKSCQSYD